MDNPNVTVFLLAHNIDDYYETVYPYMTDLQFISPDKSHVYVIWRTKPRNSSKHKWFASIHDYGVTQSVLNSKSYKSKEKVIEWCANHWMEKLSSSKCT